MIVLFAGPLPGLILAVVLATVSRSALAHEAVLILAGVNFFNLLPILPLDGGQIALMLFFARHPWLDVAFRAMAGVALLLLAVLVPFGIFFAALGAFTLVQLPKSRRQAALRRGFRQARQQWPEAPPALLFFRVLRATPQAAASFVEKFTLARLTLAGAEVDTPVKWRSVFGWASAYAAVFALACAALSLTFSGGARTASRKPAEPVPVASLACPLITSQPSEQAEGAPPPNMVLGGVATFASHEAATAARRTVVAAESKAAFQTLGPALFVWTKLFDAEEDVFDFDAVIKARDERVRQLATSVSAAGGRFYNVATTPPGMVAIDCNASDEVSAQAIADTLTDHLVAIRNMMWISPPWASTPAPTEAQALARRTFRIAMKAANYRVQDEPIRTSTLFGLLTGGTKQVKAQVQKRQARRAQRAEAALSAERARRPIDEEVARLVVTEIATISGDERERVRTELRNRLGAADPESLPSMAFGVGSSFETSHSGSRVRVQVENVSPKQFDTAVRPLLSWLCTRSCVGPRILVDAQ
jgi:hypothetical protein